LHFLAVRRDEQTGQYSMGCSSSVDGAGGLGSGSCIRLPAIIELSAESELMTFQIHAAAAKGDALHFQQKPLLEGMLARYANRAASAHHAVPRQSFERAEGANYLPRSSRRSGGGGDLSIGGHLSSRDLSDGVRKND
jgi:hypothetical protein